MNRRAFFGTLAGGLFAAPLAAEAQAGTIGGGDHGAKEGSAAREEAEDHRQEADVRDEDEAGQEEEAA